MYTRLPYDALRDLVPVTDLISSPLWLAVNPVQMPVRTFQEFVEMAKARPRDFSYASVGNGSIGHLYGMRLNEAAGLSLLHVPYKGAAPTVLALLGGEVAVALTDYATLKPHLLSGKLRVLAVSSPKRSQFTPDVPTFGELGLPGFESSSWIALFAPARTPPEIVQRLHAEAGRLLRQPDISAKFMDQGFALGATPSAQFAAQVVEDHARWGQLIRKAGIKLD
jgi:tripartite-type tricarboxylate transporter receptor subunit TctC